MQALMDFKRETSDSLVGNEDMQEEIKAMLKRFHGNLLCLQQVSEVKKKKAKRKVKFCCSTIFRRIFLWTIFWSRQK